MEHDNGLPTLLHCFACVLCTSFCMCTASESSEEDASIEMDSEMDWDSEEDSEEDSSSEEDSEESTSEEDSEEDSGSDSSDESVTVPTGWRCARVLDNGYVCGGPRVRRIGGGVGPSFICQWCLAPAPSGLVPRG